MVLALVLVASYGYAQAEQLVLQAQAPEANPAEQLRRLTGSITVEQLQKSERFSVVRDAVDKLREGVNMTRSFYDEKGTRRVCVCTY